MRQFRIVGPGSVALPEFSVGFATVYSDELNRMVFVQDLVGFRSKPEQGEFAL